VTIEEARMKARTAALWAAIAGATLPGTVRAQQLAAPSPETVAQEAAAQVGAATVAAAQVRPTPRAPATPAQPAKPTLPSAGVSRRQPGRPGSLEISGGALFLGPGSLGSSTALLTANSSSTPFTFFTTSARAGGTAGLDARLAYNLTRVFAVEGGFLYSRPKVNFSVSGDTEGAAGFTTSGDKLSQYFADANVVVFLSKLGFAGGRARPFVEGGAGYLRQLHAGNFNVDTGTVYNGGAGLKYYFKPRPKGLVKAFGVRVDLRAYYKRGGFSFDGSSTWTAALGGGAIVAF
jgi:hypothetical protein